MINNKKTKLMQVVAYKIIPDLTKNSITYSKNYRIFSTGEPFPSPVKITDFTEDIDLGSADPTKIIRKLRYSTDRGNWSLWYNFSTSDLSEITTIDFNSIDTFFDIKYEYDDTTYSQLASPLLINSIKFKIQSTSTAAINYTPGVECSTERCPALVSEKEALFQPYAVDSAIDISRNLSFNTNKLFGVDVVYFKTEPDRSSGDFIFKEWTLAKTTDRKCIKVVVPNNIFPDNKPNYTEYGVDFEVPFEIHIDHIYFQMMFGPNSQPRKRDYMFFPLTNRMYEIQGSYLFRGFMMEPLYWKIQLTKYHPNVDMTMSIENKKFLDNIIMSSDELFGKQAEIQKEDALNKKQFSTISNKFDETRKSLHSDLTNRILDYTFNYSPLIEYYYDMSGIKSIVSTYTMNSAGTTEDQYLTSTTPYEIYAYEDSEIYQNWMSKQLNTGDSNIIQDNSLISIKMNGPKDSYTVLGKYVVVEGYKNLALRSIDRRDIFESTMGQVKLKQSEHGVIYKSIASTDITPNMTFSALIKFNRGSQNITIFDGYDNILGQGLVISCSLSDNSGIPAVTMYVRINETQYQFAVGELNYDKWYSLIMPVSSTYGQLELTVYSFSQDPANIKNYNGIIKEFTGSYSTGKFSFVTIQNWTLPSANYSIANIRLFNTMVQEEDHEFIISQLFIRDESMLELIDNCRPRLNMPFIAINR